MSSTDLEYTMLFFVSSPFSRMTTSPANYLISRIWWTNHTAGILEKGGFFSNAGSEWFFGAEWVRVSTFLFHRSESWLITPWSWKTVAPQAAWQSQIGTDPRFKGTRCDQWIQNTFIALDELTWKGFCKSNNWCSMVWNGFKDFILQCQCSMIE